MPFDPSKPYEEVVDESSGFDPSKPYEEVKETVEPRWYNPSTWTYNTAQLKQDFGPDKLTELREAINPTRPFVPLDRLKVTASDLSANPSTTDKVVAGLNRGSVDLAQSFESPLGVATLGIGLLPKALGRGVSGLFAADMARHVPEQARELGAAVGTGDTEKAVESGFGLAANAGFSGLAGAHATGPLVERAIRPSPVREAVVPVEQVAPEVPTTKEPNAPNTPEIPKPEQVQQPLARTEVPPEVRESVQPTGEEPVIESGGPEKVEPPVLEPKLEVPAEPMKSLGAMAPGDPLEIQKADLAQLTDATKDLQIDGNGSPRKAFDLAESIAGVKDRTTAALEGLKAAGKELKKRLIGKPEWDNFKAALGDRHLALSESKYNADRYVKGTEKLVKDKTLREAISDYIDAGGDVELLRRGAAETKPEYKAGYERAMKLTPEEKNLADQTKSYFESRLKDAQDAGILEAGVENYLHRMYEAESPWKQKIMAELGSGIFTGNPTLARKRVFEYDFEAEQAGLRPVKNFIKRVAAYDLALNKAIADRKAVKEMMKIKMPDGRPMIDVAGRGTKVVDPSGSEATLIDPGWKVNDPETPLKNRADFKAVDHPALRKWKWASADDAGNPVFVQGDVLVHPDALQKVNNLFERSRVRANPAGRAALNFGSTVKQTMLDLSLFHFTQIGVHGFEHRSFKPVKEIDFTDPKTRGLIRGGLVVGETTGRGLFDEGLSGSSLTKHIPGVGPALESLKSYLFESYIPRLKVSTGLHALERNRKRYPELTESQLNHLTAEQMNAAFGEQNYEMMGRSKTTQDVLRLALLAPDFLEARARFAAQSTTKYGREQLSALSYGLVGLYVTARIINKILSDQYHFEKENAFNIVYNGKAYGLRTVQGDIAHAAMDPFGFMHNRLNPATIRPVMDLMVKRDHFGRKRTFPQTLGDIAKIPIPISLKGLFEGREQKLWESALNAMGITERRVSPSFKVYEWAEEWKKKNNIKSAPGEFVYDRDKDPYRPLKLVAIEGDGKAIREEIKKLVDKGTAYPVIVRYLANHARQPFTGSQRNDAKFAASLSADERKTFEAAKQERQKVYRTVIEEMRK